MNMPKKLSIWARTPWQIKWVGYATTILTFIYALSQTAPVAEPYMPSHRGWVRAVVIEDLAPIKVAQNQQAIAIDRFLLFQLQESRNKVAADPAASTSPVVQERIKQLDEQIRETEERVRNAK